jgi:glycosyltransferase involved in cell wall biosynthesis
LKARGTKVKLLLAGSASGFPDYFNQLQALVSALGVEAEVAFAGKVANEEMRDFYCACDAFLFPNENQTWGLAVMEAMACGCPVLVSEGAAVHEVLTDNESAVLFPPRRPDALANKIQMLIDQPQLRQRIAERGLQLTRTRYNWEQFANQLSRIFQQLAEPGDQHSLSAPADPEPVRAPRR